MGSHGRTSACSWSGKADLGKPPFARTWASLRRPCGGRVGPRKATESRAAHILLSVIQAGLSIAPKDATSEPGQHVSRWDHATHLPSCIALLRLTATLFPLATANPRLAPRALLLTSISGAKLKIFFKGVFLEPSVFVGLEGRLIKGENLQFVLDLGPEPVTGVPLSPYVGSLPETCSLCPV